MKLLLLFLAFFNLITPVSSKLSTSEIEEAQLKFLDEVEKKYQFYQIEETIEFEEFSLVIVKGIYNNSSCYGISFVPSESNTYTLVLETADSSFELPKDGSGFTAIAIKADITYALLVYDKNNTKVDMKSITLSKYDVADFDMTGALPGNNQGGNLTNLVVHKMTLRFLPVLLITFAVLIGVVGITILILFIMKKGFFNKDKRKEGVISMRDIYEADTNDLDNDGISFDELDEDQELEDSFEYKGGSLKTEESTIIPVINPNKQRDDDEADDVNQITDIKTYLHDQGFITTYDVLEEDEKNKIMMELIKLKNEGKISMDAYYKETYELWKK